MIFDLEKIDSDISSVAQRQVAIIGAGAVGLALGVSLARKGVSVLLVETGGVQFEQRTHNLNAAVVSGRHHDGVFHGRARVLGGTTTLWGGQLAPFSDIDFQKREWIPGSGWPISSASLASYYEQASKLLCLSQEFTEDEAVWKELGLDCPVLGEDLEVFFSRWLKETNFARLFKVDINACPNLCILLHATACGFTLNEGSGRLDSLQVRSISGQQYSLKADSFVIAAGTIEASRLMLYAAEQNPRLPWCTSPWVGAGFQDHLDLRAARVHPISKSRFDAAFDNIYLRGYKFQPKIRLCESFQEQHKLLNIAASFSFDSSITEQLANIKLFFRALLRGSVPPNWFRFPQHLAAVSSIFGPLVIRYLKEHRAFNPADMGIFLTLHCEQMPLLESAIRLEKSKKDALDMPLTQLHWKVDGGELDTMAEFCNRLDRTLVQHELAKLEIHPLLAARDAAILDYCHDSNHHCGGLRMGTSPKDGVVDENLRVFGTENLFVAGASVFPTSSHANPTFTAIALALRLSDYLHGKVCQHG